MKTMFQARRTVGGDRIVRANRIGSLMATVALFFVLPVAPADAAGTHVLKEVFGSAAQPTFGDIGGVAVDRSTGDVLVIDPAAQTVSRFKPNGEADPFSALGTNVLDGKGVIPPAKCTPPSAECDGTPQQKLSFSSSFAEQQIAVDNSGGINDGNIYVTQGSSAAGVNLIDIFATSGEYLGQLTAANGVPFGKNALKVSPTGVTVDSSGALFVGGAFDNKIYKYVPSANPPVNADWVASFSTVSKPSSIAAGAGPTENSLFVNEYYGKTFKINADTGAVEALVSEESSQVVAVDPGSPSSTGNVFAAGSVSPRIREYEAVGTNVALVSRFDDGYLNDSGGLAIGSTGEIYVSGGAASSGGALLRVYTPLVFPPVPVTGPANVSGDTSATLTGTVNPEGQTLEECYFEYGETTAYGRVATCEEPAASEVEGSTPVPVHVDLTGLDEETRYHYRLVAKNAVETVKGKDASFKSPSRPSIVAAWAASVGAGNATLKATINPENDEASFFVEWGVSATYGNKTAAQLVASGRDQENHVVSVDLQGLAPGATYHWRIVASNSHGTVEGDDRSFTTFAAGERSLPDGRVYELVSPQDKNNAEIGVPPKAGILGSGKTDFGFPNPQQAAPSGAAVSFHSATAFGADPKSAPVSGQYLSSTDPGGGGWRTANIDPPFEEGYLRNPIVGLSADLSRAIAIVIAPALAGGPAGFANIYLRDNVTGSLRPLITEAPRTNLADGERFCVSYGGASADFTHIFFAANGAFRTGDPAADGYNLYEWTPYEGVQLVSRLPTEAPAVPSRSTGFGDAAGEVRCKAVGQRFLRHAVAADGSRVVWTYSGRYAGSTDPLLARIDGFETVQLDAKQGGTASGGGVFWDASVDGAHVFFTDAKRLTADSSESGSDLYLYDLDKWEAEDPAPLLDLTPTGTEGANVQGVLGASSDGTFVYYVATGRVTGDEVNPRHEQAQAAEPNLYVWHQGEGNRFIATLNEGDRTSWEQNPEQQAARVSPDGQHVAFLSAARLTGYDNSVGSGSSCGVDITQKALGPGCQEAFIYDFATDDLTCASCNPSNARPLGTTSFPAWSAPETQSRFLADRGDRVYFQTPDALTVADSNGQQDVYQWEREGTGSCTASSLSFHARNGGCIDLVSSGQSSQASYFVDASASGDDVFFATRQRLVRADLDQRFDLYDARVGGSIELPPPPGCEGEGCRGQGTSGGPGQASGTAHFVGPGNRNPKRRPRCRKTTRKVRHESKRKPTHKKATQRAKRGSGKKHCVKVTKRERHRHHHRRQAHSQKGGRR